MDENTEPSLFLDKKVGASSLIFLIAICLLGISLLETNQKREVNFEKFSEENPFFTGSTLIQGNSLFPASGPLATAEESEAIKTMRVIVTAYSSSPWETDDTPYLTASGTTTRDGVVATNILPFGTKVKFSSLYGDKIFVVEDRMSLRKGYQVDIWHPSYWEAKQFGAKLTEMEIIEEG